MLYYLASGQTERGLKCVVSFKTFLIFLIGHGSILLLSPGQLSLCVLLVSRTQQMRYACVKLRCVYFGVTIYTFWQYTWQAK